MFYRKFSVIWDNFVITILGVEGGQYFLKIMKKLINSGPDFPNKLNCCD